MSIGKPLTKEGIKQLQERFDFFKDAELISMDILNPQELILKLHLQDRARDFDWIELEIFLSGIEDAKLPGNSKLKAINLHDGISIISSGAHFALGYSSCKSIEEIKESLFYIIARSVKIKENSL